MDADSDMLVQNVTFSNLSYASDLKKGAYLFKYDLYSIRSDYQVNVFRNCTFKDSIVGFFKLVSMESSDPSRVGVVEFDDIFVTKVTLGVEESLFLLDSYKYDGNGTIIIKNSLFEDNEFENNGRILTIKSYIAAPV